MRIEEQIQTILDNAADGIRQKLATKGINASGRTSAAIGVHQIASGFQLGKFSNGSRTAPIETLEIGRPAGAVPHGFKSIIYQWTIDKGITTESNSHRWAIATQIAKKIRDEGTERHKHHVDVYSTITKEAARDIASDIRNLVSAEISQIIQTNF